MMKKCPSCDKENQEQSSQCEHCGVYFDHFVETPIFGVKPFGREDAWSVFSHVGGLFSIAIIPILIPFLIWLFHKKEPSRIVDNSKNALNFQLSILSYVIAIEVLRWTILGGSLPFLLFQLCVVFNFICSLIAIFQVSQRKEFNYPLSLKLIP